MNNGPRVVGALFCGWLAVGLGIQAHGQTPAGDAERADAIRIFEQRLGDYVALRERFEGVIFTPRVAAMFRVLVTQAVYDEDIEGMLPVDWLSRDYAMDLVADERLPQWAMTKVPKPLLARLPPLPDAIEYRLVDGALILWDVHAELLIDWLPDPVLTD